MLKQASHAAALEQHPEWKAVLGVGYSEPQRRDLIYKHLQKLLDATRTITHGDTMKAKQLIDLLHARAHAGEVRAADAMARAREKNNRLNKGIMLSLSDFVHRLHDAGGKGRYPDKVRQAMQVVATSVSQAAMYAKVPVKDTNDGSLSTHEALFLVFIGGTAVMLFVYGLISLMLNRKARRIFDRLIDSARRQNAGAASPPEVEEENDDAPPAASPASAPTKRWLDRVVPADPTDAVQKLLMTKERVLRSSNEIVRQMFLYTLLYVAVAAFPVVWSRVVYLLPLVLLTYNMIALKTLSVYVHGSIRGRLLRKLLPTARASSRVSMEVEAPTPEKG